jgi:hypothetical protein
MEYTALERRSSRVDNLPDRSRDSITDVGRVGKQTLFDFVQNGQQFAGRRRGGRIWKAKGSTSLRKSRDRQEWIDYGAVWLVRSPTTSTRTSGNLLGCIFSNWNFE